MGHRELVTAIRGARLTIICAPIPDYGFFGGPETPFRIEPEELKRSAD